MADNVEKKTESGLTCEQSKNDRNVSFQIEGSPMHQPNRARLSLPLRSATLNQTSTEIFADLQSQQLIQSSSLEGVTGYAAASTTVPSNADPAAISTSNNDNENFQSDNLKRLNFKTKRFYESEDNSSLIQTLFSQTIRSTTATPTEDVEIVTILEAAERAALKESETTTETNIPEADNTDRTPPTPLTTPTTPPPSEPNYSEAIDTITTDFENLSGADHSIAESQTENFEMYNEPNMSSIIDNVNDECEDVIKDIDEDVISERRLPVVRPSNQPAGGASARIRRPSIVVELYTDTAVKSEECKIDGECGYVSPPLWKTILQPTIPTSVVSYFDTTIEEDEEEDEQEQSTFDIEKEHRAIGAAIPTNNILFDTLKHKSRNTELVFDPTTISPIQEAAGLSPTSTDGKRTDIEKDDDKHECDKTKPKEEDNDEQKNNDKPRCSNIKKTNKNDFVYQIEKVEGEDDECIVVIVEEKDKESVEDSDEEEEEQQSENDNEDEFGFDEGIGDEADNDDDNSEHEVGAVCDFQMTMDNEATKTTVVSKTKKTVSKRAVSSTSSSTLLSSADIISPTSSMITMTMSEKVASEKLKSPKKTYGTDATLSAAATTSIMETAFDEIQVASTSTSSAVRSEDGTSIEVTDKRTQSKSSSTSGKKKTRKSKKSESQQRETIMKKIYLTEKLSTNWKTKDHHARTIEINRDVSVKHLRVKSFNDVGRNEASKLIRTGVSVRALRDSYCSLVGIGSDCNINRADYSAKKSSFSKFDALQKKNILHVRSSDSGKAQEKFGDNKIENEQNCRACSKVVYKMEEMKAEKNIWHRNCFKCIECGKLLNVDTYQSHESVLYCKPHFKLLFAPKAVEDNEPPAKPRKPELIIRENQPEELPPDVVRASDKPDLGLDELHQLNVKSRFQVFENYQEQAEQQVNSVERSPSGVKRSASILSKLAKFQAKGLHTGVSDDALNSITYEQSSSEEEEEDNIPEGEDADLIRAKRAQRERPMSFTNMNDIKTKFESGHVMTKEERREERKQEIQNIRSRLFMGKQARIKEMYQQAVADSEQGITSSSKKPEIEIGDKARSLKEKFEKGEITNREDDEEDNVYSKVHEEDVFEQGISKKSRSIFMELDASASKSPQSPMPATPRTPDIKKLSQVSPLQVDKLKPFPPTENVVKCDEKQDDIKIETSEISSKFKFFESYKPSENKKKEFRITPPREGVVKMPSPDREVYVDPSVVRSEEKIDDPTVAEQTHTATKVLSMFRQMEQQKYDNSSESGPKPLKRFTPPPDNNRRVLEANDSDEDGVSASDDEEYDGEEEEEQEESEEEKPAYRYEDEILKQAQAAARAKQLRAKFEKWEANEIQRELSNGTINIYEKTDENDESQIESAKSLRAKFESMREVTNKNSTRPRVQVNRFV